MRLALTPYDQWFKLSDQLKRELNIEDTSQVGAYRGIPHALFEAVMGIAQLLPHKKSFVYIPGATPYFQSLIPLLVRDGFKAIETDVGGLTEVINQNSSEIAFVLMAEDHAVTGELFDFKEFDQLLVGKRIISLRVSHYDFWKNLKVDSYSARIGSINSDLAVMIFGQRMKLQSALAKDLYWDSEQTILQVKQSQTTFKEDKKLVLDFEAKLQNGFVPFFSQQQERCYDRSVIVHPKFSGEALMSFLNEKWIHKGLVDTPNLCKWGGVGVYDQWWRPAPSAEAIRGMLVLDLKALALSTVHDDLKWAISKCQV